MNLTASCKIYSYVGDDELKSLITNATDRALISRASDVLAWLPKTRAKTSPEITATFTVNTRGELWIVDRHSEHIVCAQGGEVLSAGEMTFQVDGNEISVADVSNQSTGYCPEPSSWPAVAMALDKAGFIYPGGFTRSFTFRLCEHCGQRNIVKDGDFTCGVCGTELEQEWNFL